MRRKPIENQWRKKSAGGVPFEGIDQQHKNSRRFAERAHGVRRADVAAADVPDINALRPGRKVTRGNRAQEIRSHGDDGITQN